ncbi:XRE family transcriptional regulator [Gordonibacter massiliensis (ex Traore et al. 2017)]|uniref:XRE family transcriptional regulator n=1 Tax=Gordonibacter massiliensis (ex Traore et al. 2017) TaxID=1841863 RepID=A0A842JLA9_9ACTN|nr:XRE family transcriptional regulator [Gordonibacter massiliensis (ex Traore et al. 2017)]MBC2890495.1 XRE family transcriptional regulator [Gordonibacter massiliensis (ex Traore et al. 2017)]MBX9034795.1 XRE family transcriptional regulator [Gordonibacter massiliensis (ex Traore et al. 2017)]
MNIHEYAAMRGVTQEMRDQAQRDTKAKIDAYSLAQARRELDLTQSEVAAQMGVSQCRVSELESGRLASMRIDTLSRYVASLGGTLVVSAEWPDRTILLAR